MLVLNKILISLVHIYRWIIAPVFPSSCKYHPSCSTYALDALRKYGAFKGGWISLKRVFRCNPFSSGGVDPVN